MSHTPGPWTGAGPSFGDPLPRYTTEIVTEWEGDEGDVISICELPFAHHDDENEANARLIAAAPELLMLVRHVVKYHEPEALNLLFGAGWSEHANKVLANVDGEASLSQTKSPV